MRLAGGAFRLSGLIAQVYIQRDGCDDATENRMCTLAALMKSISRSPRAAKCVSADKPLCVLFSGAPPPRFSMFFVRPLQCVACRRVTCLLVYIHTHNAHFRLTSVAAWRLATTCAIDCLRNYNWQQCKCAKQGVYKLYLSFLMLSFG